MMDYLKLSFQKTCSAVFETCPAEWENLFYSFSQKLPFSNVKQVQNRWTLEVSVLECYVICSEYELVGVRLQVH